MNLILSHRQTLAALLTAHRDATAALLAAVRSGHDLVSKGNILSDYIDTTTYRKTHSEVLDYIRHQYRPTMERVQQTIRHAILETDADKYIRYALAEQDDSTMGLRLADADTVAASVFVWCQRAGLNYRPHFAADVLQRIGSAAPKSRTPKHPVKVGEWVHANRALVACDDDPSDRGNENARRVEQSHYRVVDVGDDDMTAWARHEVYAVGSAFMARRIGWDEYHEAMVRYQPYIHDQNIVPVRG